MERIQNINLITKRNFIFRTFFIFVVSLQLAAGQSAIALDKDAEIGDYREKIINTAKELGIGVYEDLPVEFAGATSGRRNNYSKYEKFVSSKTLNFRKIPEVPPPAFAYANENNQNGFGKGKEFKIDQTEIKRYAVSNVRAMPKTAAEEKAGEPSFFVKGFTGVRNFFGSIFKKNDQTDSRRQVSRKISKPSVIDNIRVCWGYVFNLFHAMRAVIVDSGFLPGTIAVPSFDEISKNAIAMVKNSDFKPRKAGQPSLLKEEGFIKELETLSQAKFTEGNTIKFLIDGKVSFAMKDKLMKEAKKSVYIGAYLFFDDITGNETADILIAKKKQGLDIKIIVDHKIACVLGARVIKRMQKAGIEILRYMESDRRGDYWHVKLLIVDDKYAIVGGMNYGDYYSHKNPDVQQWRDTDVLYSGPAVMETKKIFAEVWNNMAVEKGLDFKKIDMDIQPKPDFNEGFSRVAVVYQNPPAASSSPILLSILKAIYGATERVNIENAYFIAIPAVEQAILDARVRGVEVNILTNSKKSINEGAKQFMSDAILKSLPPLVTAGVNVYIKQGDNLHSKFMTVDGIFSSIGSYNLQPKCERYETELNVNIIDAASVGRLDAVFAKDISEAKKINSIDELNHNPGWLARILEKYFFSMLSPEK